MRVLRVGLLLGALLAAGCVSVPTGGPVVEGRPAGEPLPPPNVAVLPTGPRVGDDPVAIVEGFLSSMASYEPGYPTAREYLTPAAATAWEPESGIAVYGAGEGSRRVSEVDGGVQTVLALVGDVGADGSYTAAPQDSTLVLDFAVEQVDGEWRIATPPEGLVMTQFDFTREFAAYASYFYDPAFEVLVPDLTYLPVRGNLPALLVEELLDGPTEWLAPGVRSALGPGVSLTSGTVPLSGTTAQVDLTAQVSSSTPQQRDRLAAQLAWTLRQAPGVAEVAVLAGGQPLPLPASDTGVVTADSFAFLDPAAVPAGASLFAIADGAVARVDGETAVRVPGPLGEPGRFRSVGLSLTATNGAAVTAEGTGVALASLAEDAEPTEVAVGTDLAVPSVDRQGRVWLVDRTTNASTVLLLERAGEPQPVPGLDLDGVRVERLSVAPDGVRVALVYSEGEQRRLALALVLDEVPTTLGQLRDLAVEDVTAIDVAWASATALALLASDVGQPQPYLVELSNGSLSSRGQVEEAVSLAAAPGQPLVVGTAPGVLLRQDALQEWVPVAEGTAPTYPG